MSTAVNPAFERQQAGTLMARLREPRRVLQIVAGARQVGRTTLVGQVLSRLEISSVFASADEPTVGGTAWLAAQWERGRLAAADAGRAGAVLVLDEVQKIPRWSETVKRLWDEDSRARRPLTAVILGSAPLLRS
jgi:predicted AAA+ superfamily ATPase